MNCKYKGCKSTDLYGNQLLCRRHYDNLYYHKNKRKIRRQRIARERISLPKASPQVSKKLDLIKLENELKEVWD